MRTLSDVLARKGSRILTIGPEDSVYLAIKLMSDHGVGSLVVTEGDAVAGIVTERDYARKIVLAGRTSHGTQVREIMTARVLCGGPADRVDQVIAFMSARRIRHLPVVEGSMLLGLVSLGDLAWAVVGEQEFVITQLECYIRGEVKSPPEPLWERPAMTFHGEGDPR